MEAVELVKSYACGEETYHLPLDPITGLPNNQTIVHRHHVFLETTEKFYLTELSEMIMEFLGQDETKSETNRSGQFRLSQKKKTRMDLDRPRTIFLYTYIRKH